MTSAFNGARRLFVGGLALSLLAGSAFAQAPITFMAGDRVVGRTFKVYKPVAVPAYQIAFITAQQGTAAASIEARARLTTVLANVDPAVMKRLTNEAHADLKTKLVAAGFEVLPDDVARSAAAGAEMIPGNMEIKPITSGITIGAGVQKGWASFGADAAPAIKAYNNPGANPTAAMAALGANRALAQGSRKIQAALIAPSLIIDFADTSASNRFGSANIAAKTAFTLRVGTATNIIATQQAGPAVGLGGALGFTKDIVNPTPFATVATGEAAVRALSTGPTDGLGNRNTRGDAVVVDLAVWEGLVRQTFQTYNAAVVAAALKGRA